MPEYETQRTDPDPGRTSGRPDGPSAPVGVDSTRTAKETAAERSPEPPTDDPPVPAGPTDAGGGSGGRTTAEPSAGPVQGQVQGQGQGQVDGHPDGAGPGGSAGAVADVPDESTAAGPPAPGRSSRFSKAQLLVGLLVASLGFAIVVQLRQTEQQGLTNLRQSDLVRILDDVGTRRDRLAAEASDLESQRRRLTDVRTGDQAALDAARRRASTLGILAGTVPATGPGVEVYITDPGTTVRAATLLDLVQELRDAGAEAIQIGSARVIASTSFSDVDGGVAIDNMMLRPPYTVRAIGDGQTMATALEIPGGVIASIPEGAHATVATRDEVDVSALHALPDSKYVRPAVTPTPAPSGS